MLRYPLSGTAWSQLGRRTGGARRRLELASEGNGQLGWGSYQGGGGDGMRAIFKDLSGFGKQPDIVG